MSLRPLTSRTRIALAIARAVAAGRGDTDLSPVHVAIGIFEEGANPALGALWYAGMGEQAQRWCRAELERALGEERGRPTARQVAIDSGPGEEEVLRLSDLEAEHFNDRYIGTEHILLAILRSDTTVAGKVAERGISVQMYYDGLLSMRRGDPPPSEPSAV